MCDKAPAAATVLSNIQACPVSNQLFCKTAFTALSQRIVTKLGTMQVADAHLYMHNGRLESSGFDAFYRMVAWRDVRRRR